MKEVSDLSRKYYFYVRPGNFTSSHIVTLLLCLKREIFKIFQKEKNFHQNIISNSKM